MTEFDRCYPYIQQFEGGYSDNVNDPGGATQRGVTDRVYQAWRKANHLPPQPVKLSTPTETRSIYFANYWQASRSNNLSWPLDLLVFDTAVNSGVSRALEFSSYTQVPAKYLSWRLFFVRWLTQSHSLTVKEVLRAKKAKTFLRGWEKRIDVLRSVACPEIASIDSLPRLP